MKNTGVQPSVGAPQTWVSSTEEAEATLGFTTEILSLKKKDVGCWRDDPKLRTLATPAEDLGSGPSTQMVAHNYL